MRFDASTAVLNGATSPDPETAPEDVPSDQFLELGRALEKASIGVTRALFGLEAPTGETVTFDLWAVDESTLPNSNADEVETPATLAARRFYRVATGQVAIASILLSVVVPGAGRYFCEVTAETLTADATLRAVGAA